MAFGRFLARLCAWITQLRPRGRQRTERVYLGGTLLRLTLLTPDIVASR